MGAIDNFVQVRGMPTVYKISVCFWIKAPSRHHMAIFSYLGTKGTKELVMNVVGIDELVLTVGGKSV